jgi:predicted transcriptional regulator
MLAPTPTYVRPSKQIGLRLPADLHTELTAIAKKEDRSLPYVIKRLLAEGLERERAKMTRAKG